MSTILEALKQPLDEAASGGWEFKEQNAYYPTFAEHTFLDDWRETSTTNEYGSEVHHHMAGKSNVFKDYVLNKKLSYKNLIYDADINGYMNAIVSLLEKEPGLNSSISGNLRADQRREHVTYVWQPSTVFSLSKIEEKYGKQIRNIIEKAVGTKFYDLIMYETEPDGRRRIITFYLTTPQGINDIKNNNRFESNAGLPEPIHNIMNNNILIYYARFDSNGSTSWPVYACPIVKINFIENNDGRENSKSLKLFAKLPFENDTIISSENDLDAKNLDDTVGSSIDHNKVLNDLVKNIDGHYLKSKTGTVRRRQQGKAVPFWANAHGYSKDDLKDLVQWIYTNANSYNFSKEQIEHVVSNNIDKALKPYANSKWTESEKVSATKTEKNAEFK